MDDNDLYRERVIYQPGWFAAKVTPRESNELMVAVQKHPAHLAFAKADAEVQVLLACVSGGAIAYENDLRNAFDKREELYLLAMECWRSVYEELKPGWDARKSA